MQSKRDQVQAHAFVMSRLTSGMLLADPDAPESPLGRTTRGVVIGTVIAVVISAAAVVYGLINPGGNDSWRTSNSLIVNKETGGRFLYVDGRLRPVRNYASALLIGGSDLKTPMCAPPRCATPRSAHPSASRVPRTPYRRQVTWTAAPGRSVRSSPPWTARRARARPR